MGEAMSRETEREGGFLDRWSRRKRAAEQAEAEAAPDAEAAPATPPEPDPEAGDAVDEAYLAALPKIEEITASTDLRPFLRKGVPQALRNAALRRMWVAEPAIRDHVDVALDYAWDFNAAGGVPGGGGVLSAEAVAKMARGLLGRGGGQEVAAQPLPADPGYEAAETPPAEKHSSAPDTVSPPNEASDGDSSAELPDEHADRARQTAATPRRRHGGATPR